MSLRWKVLILLLVTALAPLLALSVADHWAIRRLGIDLAVMTRQQLITEARTDLLQTVTSFGRLVDTESQLVGAMLWLQADAVMDHLAVHESLAVERAALTGQLRAIAEGNVATDRILRQYVVLDDGQTLIAGQAREDDGAAIDPRQTAWYRSYAALQAEPAGQGVREIRWYSRVVDPATGALTLVGLRVLRNRAGEAMGVTAIEAPLTSVFTASRLPERWASHGHVLLITCVPPTQLPAGVTAPAATFEVDGQAWAPIVLADESALGESVSVDALAEETRVLDLPGEDLQRFTEHVVTGVPGVMVTGWRERETVWAYGPLSEQTAVVLALPASVVEQQVRALQETVWGRTLDMARSSTVVLVVVLAVVLVLAWRAARTVSDPVTRTAAAAEAIARGDLDARVELPRRVRDELTQLGEAFNVMVPKLRDQMEVRQSLELAREVQQALLPAGPPTVAGLDIAGRSLYCDETGGDYYDYLPLSGDQPGVLVAVGDVVGHGIAPSLLMATARAALRCTCDPARPDLAGLTGSLNRHLCDAQFVGRFMTLLLVRMHAEPAGATFVSAGHDPPLLYDAEADDFIEIASHDVPLGIDRDWSFTAHDLPADQLGRGRVLVLGTDGIWEARDPEGAMFGKDRLQAVIREHAASTADALADAILNAVATWRGSVPQNDDITLVVARWT